MKPSDLIKLIDACRDVNVKSIKVDGLEIEFYETSSWQPRIIEDKNKDRVKNIVDTDEQSLKKLHDESILEEEIDLKEDQLAHLNLTDPYHYDQYMQRGGIDG